MKKLLTLISAIALTAAMQAEDFSLYYDTADGSAQQLAAAADIQKIVFGDGTITIVKKDNTETTTALSVVKRLYFSTAEAMSIDAAQMPLQPSEAYDLTGRRLDAQSISELPKGIYIIDGKKISIR